MSESKTVPPPNEPSASPAVRQAGCLVACGLALLLLLYVGSFAYLLADSLNEWGFCDSLGEGTLAAMEIFIGRWFNCTCCWQVPNQGNADARK